MEDKNVTGESYLSNLIGVVLDRNDQKILEARQLEAEDAARELQMK
jgi:hypothetical protein